MRAQAASRRSARRRSGRARWGRLLASRRTRRTAHSAPRRARRTSADRHHRPAARRHARGVALREREMRARGAYARTCAGPSVYLAIHRPPLRSEAVCLEKGRVKKEESTVGVGCPRVGDLRMRRGGVVWWLCGGARESPVDHRESAWIFNKTHKPAWIFCKTTQWWLIS